jgi:hypothetical protein
MCPNPQSSILTKLLKTQFYTEDQTQVETTVCYQLSTWFGVVEDSGTEIFHSANNHIYHVLLLVKYFTGNMYVCMYVTVYINHSMDF